MQAGRCLAGGSLRQMPIGTALANSPPHPPHAVLCREGLPRHAAEAGLCMWQAVDVPRITLVLPLTCVPQDEYESFALSILMVQRDRQTAVLGC